MASNEVRIIGGLWKGRKLRFPAAPGLRPTLGRVRETLFNWLIAEVDRARCADLYAGSGALGFEALSRGADSCVFVERNRKAALALEHNATALGATRARIAHTSAERFLNQSHEPWDLVFFDPPFADFNPHLRDSAAAVVLERLLSGSHLSAHGLVYIECPLKKPLPHAEEMVKTGRAGDCHFGLLGRLKPGCLARLQPGPFLARL